MQSAFTFTRMRIIVPLLTLYTIGIFAMAGTAYAAAQSTQNKQNKPQALTQPITQTPPKASCGTVDAHQGQPPVVFNGQAAVTAEDCFWRAYQQCQAKTLLFHQMGVDTGINNTLWPIKQKGRCYIANLVSNYSAIVRLGNNSSFTICTKLQKTQRGLLVSGCGKNGNLLVPAPTTV